MTGEGWTMERGCRCGISFLQHRCRSCRCPSSITPAPQHAYRIGQALTPLTKRGWLILASGNVTHNLNDWQRASSGLAINTDDAQRFSDWIHTQVMGQQVNALLAYRQSHPDALRAHPRDEHLLPLFTAVGAAGPDAAPRAFHRGISDQVIAMDGYAFEPQS